MGGKGSGRATPSAGRGGAHRDHAPRQAGRYWPRPRPRMGGAALAQATPPLPGRRNTQDAWEFHRGAGKVSRDRPVGPAPPPSMSRRRRGSGGQALRDQDLDAGRAGLGSGDGAGRGGTAPLDGRPVPCVPAAGKLLFWGVGARGGGSVRSEPPPNPTGEPRVQSWRLPGKVALGGGPRDPRPWGPARSEAAADTYLLCRRPRWDSG